MNAAEVVGLLGRCAIASSVAIVLVMLLRRPLRQWFGAGSSYAAWLAVPAALLAVLVPIAGLSPTPEWIEGLIARPVSEAVATESLAALRSSTLIMLLWIAGMALMGWRFAIQQRRFLLGLGPLCKRADGTRQATINSGLPAAIGLWRPHVVVPCDFDQRYDDEQRRLMHLHERTHIRRGDLHINAGVAALRCVFWFNPLVHFAAGHFRHDQELACDQRVIALNPQSRRAYGEAMLKTQLAAQPLPLGCHWGYSHPLTERIAMLKQPIPGFSRWIAGTTAVAALTLTVGFAAWAAQPVTTGTDRVVSFIGGVNFPRYPDEAVSAGIGGELEMAVHIDEHGKPKSVFVEISSGNEDLDGEAAAAALRWRFEPAIQDGKAVASVLRVPVRFAPGPGAPKPGDVAGRPRVTMDLGLRGDDRPPILPPIGDYCSPEFGSRCTAREVHP